MSETKNDEQARDLSDCRPALAMNFFATCLQTAPILITDKAIKFAASYTNPHIQIY
ncbi:MAG TPA: hypothetical protein PK879_09055 [Opitutaceae bacterium]|nr:hypothetical protein [Opitutaceae bacterium]HPG17091.1 hypothetical protein [Opitutaceae bacterium]HPO00844.1 hypothetical protein [Opitutaceae bacterium]